MTATKRELVIRSESVQRIYSFYVAYQFWVNRRYQRKLVWTLDEKQKLVDSVLSGYPVPLFLLAESRTSSAVTYEIVDGMQRIEAIVGYLENAYAVDGNYFDLSTIPETRERLADGKLVQLRPMLDIASCGRVASYLLALSIYRDQRDSDVDLIFRRINSGGRQLSRQELRHAGATGSVAQLVRRIGAAIRGDVSATDKLPLVSMREISISGKGLVHGIDVDTLFWVRNGILTRDMVRQSRDEELIADMLGFVLVDPPAPSTSDVLDGLFGMVPSDDPDDADSKRNEEAESAVLKHGADVVEKRFLEAHDALRRVLDEAGTTFSQLVSKKKRTARMPRYYQAVFLAFYSLLNSEKKAMNNVRKVVTGLEGFADRMKIAEGGKWASSERVRSVDQVKGLISVGFRRRRSADPARNEWLTEFENLLTQSKTENSLYDFKQGLFLLDGSGHQDPTIVSTIARALAAMANHAPGAKGYVVLGVADKKSTAERVKTLMAVNAKEVNGFYVTGIDHEASQTQGGLDKYLQSLTSRLAKEPFPAGVRTQILRDIEVIRYYDKTAILIRVEAADEPTAYGDEFLERHGPNVIPVAGSAVNALFARFRQAQQSERVRDTD